MLQTASLGKQIEGVLREQILTGRLSPGQRIPAEKLATKWGVSSTPVRDALKRLESVGLVRVRPRRGVYVSDCDGQTFKDVYDLRIALECLAVETAAHLIPRSVAQRALDLYEESGRRLRQSGDRAFLIRHDHLIHDLVIRHCGNQHLVKIMDDLGDLIRWAQNTVVTRRADSFEKALPEHVRIV